MRLLRLLLEIVTDFSSPGPVLGPGDEFTPDPASVFTLILFWETEAQ